MLSFVYNIMYLFHLDEDRDWYDLNVSLPYANPAPTVFRLRRNDDAPAAGKCRGGEEPSSSSSSLRGHQAAVDATKSEQREKAEIMR